MTLPFTPAQLLEKIAPVSGPVSMVLDTDTYNEIDDQFALVYALLSPQRFKFEAVYAAPFHNVRSSGPEEGMELSYGEIERVLERMDRSTDGFAFRGSRAWFDADNPPRSPAVDDLIARARAPRDGPLYVVGIAAITNIAAAIALAPDIIERIVVVWLGGHPTNWHTTSEFNLRQDIEAVRLVLDCGVPLVLVPCLNVAEHLRTTQAELERFVKGRGAIGDYLFEIFSDYRPEHYARSKEIWDLAPLAWLLNEEWAPSAVVPSPILSDRLTWSYDPNRHFIREVRTLKRDAVFADLFAKLEARAGATVAP